MDVVNEVREAERRIRAYIRETPVERSSHLSKLVDADVQLKLENYQRTGSFKIRGAMNKLVTLSPEEKKRGVVAASTGNHGKAVALGCRLLGVDGVVFVPQDADPPKVDAIRIYDIDVRIEGDDPVVAEQRARNFAEKSGRVYVSPYNDPAVVAGQGTIGLELESQVGKPEVVLVALGGGGLISGIGGYFKSLHPELEVVACSPQNSAVMHASLEAGKIVELESRATLSDGTAGGVEPASITFELCQRYVDGRILVSEEEIAAAMRFVIEHHHMLVEGAGAVPVAALLKDRGRFAGKLVTVILCGANVSPQVLRRVLRERAE